VSDNSQFIDALRECLDLAPLYGQRKESPLWDSHPFEDGNRRVDVPRHQDRRSRAPSMISDIYQKPRARDWQFARAK
jgi:hypothetical protein